MRDGKFGEDAAKLFKKSGGAKPHDFERGPSTTLDLSGKGLCHLVEVRSAFGTIVKKSVPSEWARTCTERECLICGKRKCAATSALIPRPPATSRDLSCDLACL